MVCKYCIKIRILKCSSVQNIRRSGNIRLGNTGYRVTMIPCDDAGIEIIEGDILAQCRIIKVVKVTEVSNHYE